MIEQKQKIHREINKHYWLYCDRSDGNFYVWFPLFMRKKYGFLSSWNYKDKFEAESFNLFDKVNM
jgi:hypothetical protein